MAKLPKFHREPGLPTFSAAEYQNMARITKARGGLGAAEQRVARRMAALGSSIATIRVELGGRYTGAQIEKAIG